jgi:hypothetical protein
MWLSSQDWEHAFSSNYWTDPAASTERMDIREEMIAQWSLAFLYLQAEQKKRNPARRPKLGGNVGQS